MKETVPALINPGHSDYESAWKFLDTAALQRIFERETVAHAEYQTCDFTVSITFPWWNIDYDMKIPLQGAYAGRTLFLPKGTKWESTKRLAFIRHTVPWPRYTIVFLPDFIVVSRILYDVASGAKKVPA